MKLLITFMMIAFAFASVTVATLNAAMAAEGRAVVAVSASPVVSDSCTVPHDKAGPVSFKPCGKLRNGMALLCHPDQGLLPARILDLPHVEPGHVALTRAAPPTPARQALPFRPPRIFGSQERA